MSNRNAEYLSRQHAKQRRPQRFVRSRRWISSTCSQVGSLLEITDSLLPEHRERLYPPTVALSMFMGQVMDEDGSCQKAVDSWAAQRAADGLSVRSVNTGAYCKARQRLPATMVSTLARHSAKTVERTRAGGMALACGAA